MTPPLTRIAQVWEAPAVMAMALALRLTVPRPAMSPTWLPLPSVLS